MYPKELFQNANLYGSFIPEGLICIVILYNYI